MAIHFENERANEWEREKEIEQASERARERKELCKINAPSVISSFGVCCVVHWSLVDCCRVCVCVCALMHYMLSLCSECCVFQIVCKDWKGSWFQSTPHLYPNKRTNINNTNGWIKRPKYRIARITFWLTCAMRDEWIGYYRKFLILFGIQTAFALTLGHSITIFIFWFLSFLFPLTLSIYSFVVCLLGENFNE